MSIEKTFDHTDADGDRVQIRASVMHPRTALVSVTASGTGDNNVAHVPAEAAPDLIAAVASATGIEYGPRHELPEVQVVRSGSQTCYTAGEESRYADPCSFGPDVVAVSVRAEALALLAIAEAMEANAAALVADDPAIRAYAAYVGRDESLVRSEWALLSDYVRDRWRSVVRAATA